MRWMVIGILAAGLISGCSDDSGSAKRDISITTYDFKLDKTTAADKARIPDRVPAPDRVPTPDRAPVSDVSRPLDATPRPDGKPCSPMDARGVGACAMFIGYFWDGKQCKGVSGCSCAGTDCNKAFKKLASCQAAYSHCLPAPPSCKAMDAKGVGLCEKHLGYTWNGKACVGLAGCSCSGADCGKLFSSKSACQTAYSGCP